jgi:hypothetical protein
MKVKIVNDGKNDNMAKIYLDDVQVDNVQAYEIFQVYGGSPLLELEILPDEIEVDIEIDSKNIKTLGAMFICNYLDNDRHVCTAEFYCDDLGLLKKMNGA